MTDKNVSLTVCRGGTPTNAFVWSPFVTKLEARLRFDHVKYTLGGGSPKTAPRGKIPYIEIREADASPTSTPSDRMGDSTMIIKHLINNGLISDLNSRNIVSPAQRATDLAIRAMMEDRVYFYGTREKWFDNYTAMRDGALGAVPLPLRYVVGWLAWRGIRDTLWGQGSGRLGEEEVLVLKEEVWESVAALLAEAKTTIVDGSGDVDDEQPFWVLGGEEPTEADATMFGFITGALVCTAAPTTQALVRKHPVIVEYANRIHARYFPDYERWE